MSDIGDIVIRARPLVIHEAVAGGRRLTKQLYMQMQSPREYPLLEKGYHFLGWVELHWKDCNKHDWMSVSYEHRHTIAEKQGRPWRVIVFKPIGDHACIDIDVEWDGGRELAALAARVMLKNPTVEAKRGYQGDYSLALRHREHEVSLEIPSNDEKWSSLCYSSYVSMASNEPDAGLVALALPAIDESELLRAVDKAVQEELDWRRSLAETWRVVTEETPQVFV